MGTEKVGVNISKEIIAWTRTGKSLLNTRPVKVNIRDLKFAPALEKDTVLLNQKAEFDSNWEFVKDAYKSYHRKPFTCDFSVDTNDLSEMEKCINLYISEEGISEAVNMFCRDNFVFSFFKYYTKEVMSKYRDALKFALENTSSLKSYKGKTYRWQPEGSFMRNFNNPKEGEIIKNRSFISTSDNIIGCDQFRREASGEYLTPELIIIEGKSGKKMNKKVTGRYSRENEVIYNIGNNFRYIGTKKVSDPKELNLAEHIQAHKGWNKGNYPFKPCDVIFLEEI